MQLFICNYNSSLIIIYLQVYFIHRTLFLYVSTYVIIQKEQCNLNQGQYTNSCKTFYNADAIQLLKFCL